MRSAVRPIEPYGVAADTGDVEPVGYLEGVRLASAAWRLASTAIDLFVTVFVPVLLVILLKSHPNLPIVGHWLADLLGKECLDQACSAYSEHPSNWPFALVFWAVIANSVVMQGRTGQSIGKRLLSNLRSGGAGSAAPDSALGRYTRSSRLFDPDFELRLARAVRVPGHGKVLVYPGVVLCLARLVAHVLDVLPLLFGFLRPALKPLRQTFADERTGTVVLGERRQLYVADGRSIL